MAAPEYEQLLEQARTSRRTAWLAASLVLLAFVYGTTLLVLAATHMR